MELLWQNGQVVVQSQNQRPLKKSPVRNSGADEEIPTQQLSAARQIRWMENDSISHHRQQQQLFMQEDEMASWLHYPIDDSSFDHDIYPDRLYPSLSAPISTTTTKPETPPREIRTTITEIRQPPSAPVSPAPRPPMPPPSKRIDSETAPKFQNFVDFSSLPKTRIEPEPPSSSKAARESTVVESNDTPSVGPESRVAQAAHSTAQVSGGNVGCGTMSFTAAGGKSSGARDLATTCEHTVTSSSGGSGGSASESAEPPPIQRRIASTVEDLKRKGRETADAECHNEFTQDIEFESADGKKQARRSTSTKRSRAAEVHNLSERRRRDRINEKMRALQELIPRCNKSDKSSMLDEAIEYLKSLQLQVQMMSMGCGMLPMMYPGVQQYMPAMGMGMGMGMAMDMGMNRPMMPYPSIIPGSGMPTPAAPANMGPRFPVPAFHMQPMPVPDPSRTQACTQPDPMLSSLIAHNPNQPRVPNFSDPYQQFMAVHSAQLSLPLSQAISQPMSNKPSSSRDVGNTENHQTG